jgi:acyl-coenzyme A synthetase/AMP-(fatty) acid ligase
VENNFAKYIIDINTHRKSKIALSGQNSSLTYGELEEHVCGFSQTLLDIGVEPEDKVMIHMDDCPEWVVAYLSIIKIGAVPVSVSSFFNKESVNNFYKYSNSKFIVTEVPKEFSRFNYEFYDWHSDEMCYWMLTSGSSGNCLGVVHRHDTMLTMVNLFSNHGFNIDENSNLLPSVKLSFGYGLNMSFIGLCNGASIFYMSDIPSPSKIFKSFVKNNITHLITVPAIVRSIIKHKDKCEKFTPKIVAVTGESIPLSLKEDFQNTFNSILLDVYGTSECGAPITIQTMDNHEGHHSGKPPHGVVCSIRDQNNNEVPDGEIGELWVKHPCAGIGYWKDWKRTKDIFVGEWTRTGDTMLKLPDGNYKYISRNNDIIKINSMYVSPTEIESVILTINGIEDAAVVSKENNYGIHEIHAFVITNKNLDLRSLLSEKLDKNKIPKYFHIVEDFPRSINMKKKRFELRNKLIL